LEHRKFVELFDNTLFRTNLAKLKQLQAKTKHLLVRNWFLVFLKQDRFFSCTYWMQKFCPHLRRMLWLHSW